MAQPPEPPPSKPSPEATPKKDDPRFALLFHAEVRAVIRAVLRETGVRGDMIEQLEADVIDESWEWAAKQPDIPDTVVRWKGLVRTVATRVGIDWREEQKKKAEALATPCADAEARAAAPASSHDPSDVRKALGEWNKMKKSPHADALMDARQAGDAVAEAGRELGLNERTAQKIETTSRERFIKRIKIVGLTALLPAGLAAWFFYISIQPVTLTGPDHTAARVDQPTQRREGGSDSPDGLRRRALELRRQADLECAAKQWEKCLDDRNLANSIDPDWVPNPANAKPGL